MKDILYALISYFVCGVIVLFDFSDITYQQMIMIHTIQMLHLINSRMYLFKTFKGNFCNFILNKLNKIKICNLFYCVVFKFKDHDKIGQNTSHFTNYSKL